MSAGIFEDIEEAEIAEIDMNEHSDESEPDAPTYVCEVCGDELVYAGRGAPPKYCDKHKKTRRKTTPRKATGDAAEAAAILSQANNMVALALMLPTPFALPKTGEAITDASDKFEAEARRALEASPALARTIAKAGGISGSAGLIIAYGMLASTIAPIALQEIRERGQGKDETRD